jgi:hypothetical protein
MGRADIWAGSCTRWLVLLIAQATITDGPTATKILKWGAWVTLGTAVFMFLVAQYKAWSLERDKYEAELGKNGRPEIHGEAFGFQVKMRGDDYEPRSCSATIEFSLDLCNYRPIFTNLAGIQINGTAINPPASFSESSLAAMVSQLDLASVRPELPMGKRITAKWAVDIEVKGANWGDFDSFNVERMQICVVDGFGGHHKIPVRRGDGLIFRKA